MVHHFGSKAGLVRAVDEAVVERINLALSEVPVEGSGAELIQGRAEVVAALLRNQPVLCDYLARALSEGTEASAELFHLLFAHGRRDEKLEAAGAIRPTPIPSGAPCTSWSSWSAR